MDIFRKLIASFFSFFRDLNSALSTEEPIPEEKMAEIRSDPDHQNPVDLLIHS